MFEGLNTMVCAIGVELGNFQSRNPEALFRGRVRSRRSKLEDLKFERL